MFCECFSVSILCRWLFVLFSHAENTTDCPKKLDFFYTFHHDNLQLFKSNCFSESDKLLKPT